MNLSKQLEKILCKSCGGDSFIVGMVPTEIAFECDRCHFAMSFVTPRLQESAVQVPATAPAVGHLSTETVDK